MARLVRIYYNALFGALGGLLGWMLFGEFVSKDWDWQTQALLGGALIGAMIGFFVVSVDAILDRAAVRFCRYAAYGIVLGGAGGTAGFWLGDWVNYILVPSDGAETFLRGAERVLARGLGWTFFGLAVGLSEGVAARSLGKLSYGAIGGTLGGFVGGAFFGTLMVALRPGEASYIWGQAAGLVVLGACIGSLTALVEEVLKPASLLVVRGWQEGRAYPLSKADSVVGRDEGADVLLLRDMGVEKRHATIQRRGNRFVLVLLDGRSGSTRVNEEPVGQQAELKDGDRVQLGQTVVKFLLRSSQAADLRARKAAAGAGGS